MESSDEKTAGFRASLRRALQAQEREIERLEEALRALRGRHLELRAAIEKECGLPGRIEEAKSERPGAALGSGASLRQQVRGAGVSRDDNIEEKLLRDARRFARLLVSEIALYHPEQVEQGRRNRDLYARLKVTIDRSRQAYDQRFGQSPVQALDLFHDELVKALAGDDPALLGAAYPGPSK